MLEIVVIVRDVVVQNTHATTITFDALGSNDRAEYGQTIAVSAPGLGSAAAINSAVINAAKSLFEAEPGDSVTLFGGAVAQETV